VLLDHWTSHLPRSHIHPLFAAEKIAWGKHPDMRHIVRKCMSDYSMLTWASCIYVQNLSPHYQRCILYLHLCTIFALSSTNNWAFSGVFVSTPSRWSLGCCLAFYEKQKMQMGFEPIVRILRRLSDIFWQYAFGTVAPLVLPNFICGIPPAA
jgi:hypothetical protein